MRLDLFCLEVGEQLRRVASGAASGARRAAWALEAFGGDEALATASLVDERLLQRARDALAHVSAGPHRALYAPRWEAEIARVERLLALRPAEPRPPREITRWIYERLALEPETAPDALRARKVGRRGVHVALARPLHPDEPRLLADTVALATDVFPIGEGWFSSDRAELEHSLAYYLGHDLAYSTPMMTPACAAARARRFVAAFGEDAHYFRNAAPAGRGSSWTPLTHATFDRGVAVVGRGRAGVVVVTGED